jgi:hypothetical protein
MFYPMLNVKNTCYFVHSVCVHVLTCYITSLFLLASTLFGGGGRPLVYCIKMHCYAYSLVMSLHILVIMK